MFPQFMQELRINRKICFIMSLWSAFGAPEMSTGIYKILCSFFLFVEMPMCHFIARTFSNFNTFGIYAYVEQAVGLHQYYFLFLHLNPDVNAGNVCPV